MTTNIGASIRARLLNKAKSDCVDFNQILVRFALERLLYRISQSAHSEFYVLKGALLFTLWYDMPHRATRDADFLGFGASDLDSIRNAFREIASIAGIGRNRIRSWLSHGRRDTQGSRLCRRACIDWCLIGWCAVQDAGGHRIWRCRHPWSDPSRLSNLDR